MSDVTSASADSLRSAATSSALTEDGALALLARRDLPASILESLANNGAATRHRRVLLEIARHPHTPRHVSLPLLRRLFTFELMQLAMTPATPSDLKMTAEDLLASRRETITTGERLTLARRASTRVAVDLLSDADQRVAEAALENPHLTEDWIIKALLKPDAPAKLCELVWRSAKWSPRRDVRLALLRCTSVPYALAEAIVHAMPLVEIRQQIEQEDLAGMARVLMRKELEERGEGLS